MRTILHFFRICWREVWFAVVVVPLSALTYLRCQRILKRIDAEITRLETSQRFKD